MKYKYVVFLGIAAFAGFQTQAKAISVSLGTANNFAVLAGSTVTNTGASSITGDLGVSPGTAITGFPPGVVIPPGMIHAHDAVAVQAQMDNQSAYNSLVALTPTTILSGQDLGGLTLAPGVYSFGPGAATLTAAKGPLRLDNSGDPNAQFVFQIGMGLDTTPGSSIIESNGNDPNVFFQVGSSATLGANTAFEGNILAYTTITLGNGASISCGRALAQNGAVTLDTNVVSNFCTTAQVPFDFNPAQVPALGVPLFIGLRILKKRLARKSTASKATIAVS